MPNQLGGYDITFFAAQALIVLRDTLGFGSRVYREMEQSPQERGNTITIRRPSTFESKDAPASSKQEVDADKVNLTLDQWKEVKFGLTDKDLHASPDAIVREHIRPAVIPIANDINSSLSSLYTDIPWDYDVNTSTVKQNFTQPRKILRQNGAPLRMGDIYYGIDADLEADFLEADFVTSPDKGGAAGESTLRTAMFNPVLGVEPFADGTIQEHTSGTVISAGNDNVLAVNSAVTAGDTSMDIDGGNGSETLEVGDSFTIAGNRQRYVITEQVTLSTGSATGVSFAPAAVQDYSDGDAITFDDGSGNGDNFYANMLFHRNAFGLAMAPLEGERGSMMARQQGIQTQAFRDEESGLTVRLTIWYDPDSSEVKVKVDALWGVVTLDHNLAVRVRGDV